MQEMGKTPSVVDGSTPNAARLYDYYLGGAHNFETDRHKAKELIDLWPNVVPVARFNRGFLRRVVLNALDAGVTQFLDLGSGVPTVGNVHDIAHAREPGARVVYDDYESVAYNNSVALLNEHGCDQDRITVIKEDMRDPRAVLNAPETRRVLDFDQPICVLMIAVLHFVSAEDDPSMITAAYRDALPAGSWLALTHIAKDQAPTAQAAEVERFAAAYRQTSNPLFVRDRAEITSWFDGFDLLEPGVTFLPDWRADVELDDPTMARKLAWCGVGSKPA